MDVLHLQASLGHESLDMVYHYAQMVNSNLLQAISKIVQLRHYDEHPSPFRGKVSTDGKVFCHCYVSGQRVGTESNGDRDGLPYQVPD